MQQTYSGALYSNFLGSSPNWYKLAIIAFLIINPILFFFVSPYVAGWALVLEFIFTLAMALKCYPLQPGGLLAIEAVAIGMTTPYQVLHEVTINLEVILLLIFIICLLLIFYILIFFFFYFSHLFLFLLYIFPILFLFLLFYFFISKIKLIFYYRFHMPSKRSLTFNRL